MGIRDEDLNKLYHYAKSLGIKIKMMPNKRLAPAAAWNFEDLNNPVIEVRDRPYRSKTTLILLLLHECGQHLDWIHHDKKMSKLEQVSTNSMLSSSGNSTDLLDGWPPRYFDL